jgi:plastocyanin
MQENRSFKGALIGAIVIGFALAGLIVYTLGQQQNQTPETSDVESNMNATPDRADQAAPTPSERVSVTYTDHGFEPSDLTVKKGTIITIKNESSNDVQFSSNEHPSHRDNTEMNLEVLSTGESGSYTATKVGTWGFHDHLNESRTGTVTVTE